ncbi:MAG: hypothetical protein AVDCRST_MAG30-3646, partial [uncultured Solirubrobacteraceae bacterium]
ARGGRGAHGRGRSRAGPGRLDGRRDAARARARGRLRGDRVHARDGVLRRLPGAAARRRARRGRVAAEPAV